MLDFIRGIVRPLVTFLCIAATIAFIWIGKSIPEWWQAIVAMIVGYYFAERASRTGTPNQQPT